MAATARPIQVQRSYYVDHRRYSEMPDPWKSERMEEERRTIRGPGRVGTSECNALFRFERGTPDEYIEQVVKMLNAAPLAEELARAVLAYNREPFDIRWAVVEKLARAYLAAVKGE